MLGEILRLQYSIGRFRTDASLKKVNKKTNKQFTLKINKQPLFTFTFLCDERPSLETLDLAFRICLQYTKLYIYIRFVFLHCLYAASIQNNVYNIQYTVNTTNDVFTYHF